MRLPAPVKAGLLATGAAAAAAGPADTVAVDATGAAVEFTIVVVRVGAGGPFGSKIPAHGSTAPASFRLSDADAESDSDADAESLAAIESAIDWLTDALLDADPEFDPEIDADTDKLLLARLALSLSDAD